MGGSVHRFLVASAALVVVVAGLKAAASLLVPFILALFLALLLAPLLHGMVKRGVPKAVAFVLVMGTVFALFVSLTGLVSAHLADLFAHADTWQKAMHENLSNWMDYIQSKGIEVDKALIFSTLQPEKLFHFTLSFLKGTSALLSNSLLIFFLILFMLVESFGIKKKVRFIEAHSGVRGLSEGIGRFLERIHRYFSLKALTSLATGLWITAVLYVLDVPYPLLWGIGGFMLNFIPVIGSIVAAIPPVLLTLATQGLGEALWVGGWFVVINLVIGNLLEPRLMGRGLELSELVVFVSLVFWGWVFGKVGMLLAVPLTMMVKFALETADATNWIAVLMSDRVKEEPKR